MRKRKPRGEVGERETRKGGSNETREEGIQRHWRCDPDNLIRCHLRTEWLNGSAPSLLERAKQEYLLYVRRYHELATRRHFVLGNTRPIN